MNNMSDVGKTYGAILNPDGLEKTLDHVFRTNLAYETDAITKGKHSKYKRPTPICIWGTHGIGKTDLIRDMARTNGWRFRYCAPAQFEEMGDIHGLPFKSDENPSKDGKIATKYMPPDWVPRENEEGPGILLLDDINRADDRIIRGLMQLLQDYSLFSWSLPKKWQIVCTCNPELGDYSVTTLDDAMITRMLHFTMIYDLKAWTKWAVRESVDHRGIAFVLTYPEIVNGKRTTPRSLTQFFDQIKKIPDLKKDLDLVSVLAQSSLDRTAATSFISFVNDELSQLIDPQQILETRNWQSIETQISQLITTTTGEKRMDRLNTICTRLLLLISNTSFHPTDLNLNNILNFLLHKDLPNDFRMSFHKDILNLGSRFASIANNEKVAKLLLGPT
jgi:MoxR-like ATPase